MKLWETYLAWEYRLGAGANQSYGLSRSLVWAWAIGSSQPKKFFEQARLPNSIATTEQLKNKEQRTMWLHLGVRMNQENDGFSQTWRPPGPAKIPIPLAVRKPPFTPLKSHLGASWWTLQGVTGNLHMRKGLSGRSGASRAFSRHGRSVYILGALQSSEALRAPLKYGFLKSNSKCA
jgi:hypothetical protein